MIKRIGVIGAGHEHMHITTKFGGGGHGRAGRLLDAGGIEIENNQRCHG